MSMSVYQVPVTPMPLVMTRLDLSPALALEDSQEMDSSVKVKKNRSLKLSNNHNYYYYVDINECNSNPCHTNNAMCTDTSGSYTCTCNAGFLGNGVICTSTSKLIVDDRLDMILYYADINECLTETPCDGNATCADTLGSYTCTCNTGFSGNGIICKSNKHN